MDEVMLAWLEQNSKCMKCEHKCVVTRISNIYGKIIHDVPFCSKYAIDISPDSESFCSMIKTRDDLLSKIKDNCGNMSELIKEILE